MASMPRLNGRAVYALNLCTKCHVPIHGDEDLSAAAHR